MFLDGNVNFILPERCGKTLNVELTQGVHINDSKVVAADIEAKNGVIHVIDKVLLPEWT